MSINFKDKFYLIFILTIIVNNVFSDINVTRYAAISVVIDNKLHIVGGTSRELKSPLNSIIYVDLTSDFDATNVPWVNGNNIPVKTSWGVGAVGGSNNSTIILFGGLMKPKKTTDLLHTYDANTKVWNIQKTTGMAPINRRQSSVVVDSNGKMYIFGGTAGPRTGSSTHQFFNDMYTLNTVDLTWNQVVYSNDPPFPIFGHTSTLLPDGRIVFIGGNQTTNITAKTFQLADMYKLNTFNTKDSTWSIMTANGPLSFQSRSGHSAVLSNDGRIIVYGGNRLPVKITAFPELLILDTTTNPFQWSAPNFSPTNRAPPLTLHTANLIGDQMIINFGNITNNLTDPVLSTANTYILNIKDYSWKTSYSASEANLTSPSQTETPPLSRNTIIIITSVPCGVIVIAIALFIIVRIYRKKKSATEGGVVGMPSEQ